MGTPFIGEVRLFAGNFAPNGWEFCNGQLVPIAENDALFALIGTTYGGDGQSTFALPDLRSRVPLHQGGTHAIGELVGTETVTLTPAQMPTHGHELRGSAGTATSRTPAGNVAATLAEVTTFAYGTDAPSTTLAPSVGPAGQNQPHENVQPFLCLNFIISMFGIFPNQA
jgi:microcystin-dependent protein